MLSCAPTGLGCSPSFGGGSWVTASGGPASSLGALGDRFAGQPQRHQGIDVRSLEVVLVFTEAQMRSCWSEDVASLDIENDEDDRSALQSLEDEPVTVEDMLGLPELSQYEALPDACRETCSGWRPPVVCSARSWRRQPSSSSNSIWSSPILIASSGLQATPRSWALALRNRNRWSTSGWKALAICRVLRRLWSKISAATRHPR